MDDATQQLLDFPPDLNAYERRLVHEIATAVGNLSHVSSGDGDARHISLCKTAPKNTDVSAAASSPPARTARSSLPTNGADGKSSSGESVHSKTSNEGTLVAEDAGSDRHRAGDGGDDTASLGPPEGDNTLPPTQKPCSPDGVLTTDKRGVPGGTNPVCCSSPPRDDAGASAVLCKLCTKHIPAHNYDIHVVRCERVQRRQKQQGAKPLGALTHAKSMAAAPAGGGATKKKKGKGKDKARTIGNAGGTTGGRLGSADGTEGGTESGAAGGNEADARVMEAFARDARLCQQPSCKSSVVLIGDICAFCKRYVTEPVCQGYTSGCAPC